MASFFLRAVKGGAQHPNALIAQNLLGGGSFGEDAPVVVAERYELLGRIGRGATGSVYRAFDRTLDRQVAVKLLQPGQLAAADREAQVLARIAHRNVVTIHDFGLAAGHRYLVLELLEGVNLQAWLRERPSPAEILARFIEAGQGLSATHQAGLTHRDFKPCNAILTNDGRVVVIDFGLACDLDQSTEPNGSQGHDAKPHFAEGTLAYMAPERLAGHDDDARSDQFSFCVALWEALTSANPFTGDDPLARYRAISRGPIEIVGAELGVPKHVVASLERGLAFQRHDRFPTMEELLRELERPATAQRERHTRSALMALGVAATFLIGWGVTPENASIKEAHSFDPTSAVALAFMESAYERAAAGEIAAAEQQLLRAAELMETTSIVDGKGEAEFCTFALTLPELGDRFLEQGAANQARLCYAMASRYAKRELCEGLDRDELAIRSESARGVMWQKGQLYTQGR